MKTLFVKANNRPSAFAVSVKLYEAFKQTYTESHPEDKITELDLFREHLPYLDTDLISGSFKSGRGIPLTPEESAAVAVADRYLDEFLDSDTIVFGFPLWNMSVPAVLHTYIDYLNRAGRTFKYTSNGPIGLAAGKRAILLNARGGDYSSEPASSSEMAVNFIVRNLQLFGITDIRTVIVEGHQRYSERSDELIAQGMKQAAELAESC